MSESQSLSRSRSIKDAEAAIDLFLEYRDKHGHDEDAAKAAALNEFSEAESEEVMAALSEISHTPGEGRSTAGGALPAGTSNGAQGAAPGYPGQQFDKPHSQKVHENDCPTAWAFFNKHGLGSKLPPSCLVCGQLPADAAADAAAYARAAARSKARLNVLRLCAQIGLEALQALKSPGCEWLDLCE